MQLLTQSVYSTRNLSSSEFIFHYLDWVPIRWWAVYHPVHLRAGLPFCTLSDVHSWSPVQRRWWQDKHGEWKLLLPGQVFIGSLTTCGINIYGYLLTFKGERTLGVSTSLEPTDVELRTIRWWLIHRVKCARCGWLMTPHRERHCLSKRILFGDGERSVFSCLQLCSETGIYWLFNTMFNMCYIVVKDCIKCRGIALTKHCTVCNLLHNTIVRLLCKDSYLDVNTVVALAFVSNQMPLLLVF